MVLKQPSRSPTDGSSAFNRYVGEIISEAEAEMRQNDAYLFSLDDKVNNRWVFFS